MVLAGLALQYLHGRDRRDIAVIKHIACERIRPSGNDIETFIERRLPDITSGQRAHEKSAVGVDAPRSDFRIRVYNPAFAHILEIGIEKCGFDGERRFRTSEGGRCAEKRDRKKDLHFISLSLYSCQYFTAIQ